MVSSVQRQLRSFSDYPALMETFLSRQGDVDNRNHGHPSGGGENDSSGPEDSPDCGGMMKRMQQGFRSGDINQCVRAAEELLQQPDDFEEDIPPAFFEMLMEICISKGMHLEKIERFYGFMVEKMGLFPTGKAIGLVVRALCSTGKLQEAISIVRNDLCENEDLRQQISPDEVGHVVKPIVEALVAKRSHDQASQLIHELASLQMASNELFILLLRGYISLKDLDRCLVTFDTWTRSCIIAGQASSDVCQRLFEMVWAPSPSNNRPTVEKWALAHTFCKTLFERKVGEEAVRDCGRLLIQRILADRPGDAHKYLDLLLHNPTHVSQWEVCCPWNAMYVW